VHTSRQAIRWSDMDMLGHVNNVVYFRYMEQARIEWLFSLGSTGSGYQSGQGPVIVNAHCNFNRPLIYPGDIEVKMWLGDAGRTSIGSYYELTRDGGVCADGAAKIVWIDLATGRPVPLPALILEPLRAAAG